MEIKDIVAILYERGDGEMACDLDGETGEVAHLVEKMIEKLEAVL